MLVRSAPGTEATCQTGLYASINTYAHVDAVAVAITDGPQVYREVCNDAASAHTGAETKGTRLFSVFADPRGGRRKYVTAQAREKSSGVFPVIILRDVGCRELPRLWSLLLNEDVQSCHTFSSRVK